MTSINSQNFPPELKRKVQFVDWRSETKPGDDKPTKVPYCPAFPTRRAASNDPNTWGTLEQALSAYQAHGFTGIGYVPNDDVVVVDMDGCRDPETGEIAREAREIVERFKGCYIEISPSGTGVHILCFGDPIPQKKKTHMAWWTFLEGPRRPPKCEIEWWSKVQYITLTGILLS